MPDIVVLGQRRALTELDATIGHVEERRREQLAAAARLVAAGRDPAPLRALLRLTEDYLACLRQSRSILLWEPSREEPRPGAVPAGGVETVAAGGDRPRLVEQPQPAFLARSTAAEVVSITPWTISR